MRHALIRIAVLASMIMTAAVTTASAQSAVTAEVVDALRKGGLVLLWRHPATHNDQADTDPLNLADCTRQRQLNDLGRQQSRDFGAALAGRSIPVMAIRTSPFCRAKEAAELTGLGAVTIDPDLGEGGLVVPPAENSRRARALRTLLSAAPQGGNLVLVSHRPNILDAVGVEAFTVAEGETLIYRARSAAPGFELVARVPITDWR
ncbi:MAG: histidine phosphatase family protein [Phreatobacter sp.]|uniref:histidine phosphatase family protein n=1 Tax=Phreatobacter sp. TaxID=1966341 RepID=UPI0027323768|nr:histidine phosphatase family protein [Phreatobacter sp.]MDP2802571.1 histidine phosphatase family protein [Phreatobacter sp.]